VDCLWEWWCFLMLPNTCHSHDHPFYYGI
jgi:hypothetical protein